MIGADECFHSISASNLLVWCKTAKKGNRLSITMAIRVLDSCSYSSSKLLKLVEWSTQLANLDFPSVITKFRGHFHHHITIVVITNTRGSYASLGYSDRSIRCDDCPSISVVYDTQQWRQWPACPLRQTWPNHDSLWRLTVDSKSSQRPARVSTCCYTQLLVLCSLYDTPSIPL